jgi:hypothetical protein
LPVGAHRAAWLLVCVAYLLPFPYFERLNNPNENVRVWATRAIVEDHTLAIDQVVRDWGYVNDKAQNGPHLYSGKAPGVSFLGVPVLWAQTKLRHLVGWPSPDKRATTFWLRLFAVKLPMLVFLYAFSRYVRRVTGSDAGRDVLVVALGLGTLLYPYGGLFVGHALAAAAAFSAFMLLDDPRNDRPGDGLRDRRTRLRLAAAGALAGATVMLEYQAALVSVVLAGYAAVRYRARVAAFVAGALPPAIALGAFHTALFGRPWRFPFGNVENPEFARTAHAAGFHGLSWPHLSAFPTFLFSPAYGLFAFSPVLLLGAVAVGFLVRRGGLARRDGLLVTAICLVMFLFLSGMSNWRAGWCVGPRYIATVAPFLLLAVAKLWPHVGGRWWVVALAAGLTIPSVVLNVISGALYPHYPEQFDNPVFDLAFPLLAAGHAPGGLGLAVGLRGAWSILPLGLVVLAALALATSGEEPNLRRWARQVALSIAIAAAFLLALSSHGRKPRADEARARDIVHELWEPPAGVPR